MKNFKKESKNIVYISGCINYAEDILKYILSSYDESTVGNAYTLSKEADGSLVADFRYLVFHKVSDIVEEKARETGKTIYR